MQGNVLTTTCVPACTPLAPPPRCRTAVTCRRTLAAAAPRDVHQQHHGTAHSNTHKLRALLKAAVTDPSPPAAGGDTPAPHASSSDAGPPPAAASFTPKEQGLLASTPIDVAGVQLPLSTLLGSPGEWGPRTPRGPI